MDNNKRPNTHLVGILEEQKMGHKILIINQWPKDQVCKDINLHIQGIPRITSNNPELGSQTTKSQRLTD